MSRHIDNLWGKICRLETTEAELRQAEAACTALADAAELVHRKAHMVQPFLSVYVEHGAVIARCVLRTTQPGGA